LSIPHNYMPTTTAAESYKRSAFTLSPATQDAALWKMARN
jgi:hypothetical protein